MLKSLRRVKKMTNKYQILDRVLADNANSPPQGSDEWKKLRLQFIGGSEIASVLKKNKNKSANKLVLEKLGFELFTGNLITHWGNVFEEIIRLHCEEVFTCTIKETGSVPYEHGNLSYSPDGLAVVPTLTLQKHFGHIDNINESESTQLTLFEFKCPFARVATNEIPEYYQPQVNIGMNIINVMETAIFIQATFRRCLFKDLCYNTEFNDYGHFKRLNINSNPVECGFMIVYRDEGEEEYVDSFIESVEQMCDPEYIDGLIDFGSINDRDLLEELFGNCVNKSSKIEYAHRMMYKQDIFEDGNYKKSLYNTSMQYRMRMALNKKLENKKNVIGIIPYKLLSVFYTSVPKNDNYIEENDAYNKAKRVLQCIQDHAGMDCKADVAKSVRKYKL